MASIVCLRCGATAFRRRPSSALCIRCVHERMQEALAAGRAVQKAIRHGYLPRADACVCVDCGSVARDYEHRDYTKPLDVVPVCRGCNQRRGMAADSRMRELPVRRLYRSAEAEA